MTTGWRRRRELADVGLALAVTVFAQVDLWLNIEQSTHYGSDALAAVVTFVATGALAFRRVAPATTACVVASAVAVPESFTVLTIQLYGGFVPLLIAAYSAARHATGCRAVVGCAATGLALLTAWLRVPVIGTTANIPFTFVPYLLVIVAGRMLRTRQQRHEAVLAQAQHLEQEREEFVRVAIAEERGRIARELHDIVAHCVSLMVVQAGAAEDLLDRKPAQAYEPLRSVQETGRQAVAELGRMLGLLRGRDQELALRPQPAIDQLDELAEHMSAIGLPVAFEVDGDPRPLPPGVELTIYRVVQEALTNALKHAGPAKARVELRYGEHEITVGVCDNGRGAARPSAGHGLIGMRERAGLYGGALTAGPADGGGFAVRLTLPVDEVAA